LHFITDAELKYIETLEANGKRQEAVYKVLEALGRRNTEKVASDVGYLQGIAKVAGEGWNSFWNSVYGIGRDTTIEQKVAELKDSIARMENSRGVIVDKSLLESQKKKLAEFQAQQGAAEKAAAESSKQAADVQSNTEKRRLQERLQGALLSQSLAKNEANAKLQVLDIEKRIAEIQQAAPIDSRDLAGQQKTAEQVGELKLLEMATERKKVLQEIAAVKAQPQDKPEQALAVQQQLIGLNSKLVDLESTKLGLQSQAYSGYVQQLQAFQEIKRAQELSLSFVGKTTEQVNAAIFADGLRVQTTRAIQAEYANLANGVITLTELEKRKSAIEREAAEASAAFYRLQADAMDRAYNATRGVSDAMLEYAQQSQRAGELAKQATASVLASMEDGFVNFFKTGKLNAASFVDTLIREFLRLQVVKPLMNNLVSAGGGDFFSSLFGAGTQGGVNQSAGLDSSLQAGGSVVAANGAVFGRGGVTAFANGGMFTNQIVTHPKRFAFAGGVGLMGEAGPEAVVPLRRDSRGRLGLMSAGGGSANVTVQVINQGNPLQVTSQTQTQGPDGGINIAVMVNAMQDAMAEGVAYGSGSLYHAMAGRFVKQGAG
jgi:lambda family phage tail tape measure protein